MKFKKILLLYKFTAYEIYFCRDRKPLKSLTKNVPKKELAHFKMAHDEHCKTLMTVRKVLRKNNIFFKEAHRGSKANYKNYDLIITVGGDGTFLEAARHTTNQVILGVNSSSEISVGEFCETNFIHFERDLNRIMNNNFKIMRLHRLAFDLNGRRQDIYPLNDVLITHKNPAMLCRYYIKVGKKIEEQRGSGVWVSTAAGSSGAVHSAGGELIAKTRKNIQYCPRELCSAKGKRYYLKGSVLNAKSFVELTSLMRQGVLYIDGAHVYFPFSYGTKIKLSLSKNPLKVISF